MTVGELMDALDGLDVEVLVVMAKDGEGNYYSPLAEASHSSYVAETTWSGDLDPEGEGDGEPCLVLWPTN